MHVFYTMLAKIMSIQKLNTSRACSHAYYRKYRILHSSTRTKEAAPEPSAAGERNAKSPKHMIISEIHLVFSPHG